MTRVRTPCDRDRLSAATRREVASEDVVTPTHSANYEEPDDVMDGPSEDDCAHRPSPDLRPIEARDQGARTNRATVIVGAPARSHRSGPRARPPHLRLVTSAASLACGAPPPGPAGVAVAAAADVVTRGDASRSLGGISTRHLDDDRADVVAQSIAQDYLRGYWDSPNTVSAYRRDLDDFFAHCADRRISPLTATREEVTGYLAQLSVRGRSASTIARRLVALRGFYNLAVSDHGLPASPVVRLKTRRPRTQSRIRSLSRDELSRFLAAADQATPRTAALAWLLASTGLRVSEACGARIEDLTRLSDTVEVDLDADLHARTERWLEVTCKGQLRRSVPLHPAAEQRLEQLLPERVRGPIFTTSTGRGLDRAAAARDLIRVANSADIQTPFSPHVLRHTFVTLARAAGCALEDVQDAAGHADPATTRAYDRTLQTHRAHPGHAILSLLATERDNAAAAPEARSR